MSTVVDADLAMKPRPRTRLLEAFAGAPMRRIDLVVLACVGFLLLGISVVFNRFGMLHFEWWGYVPYHLGPGSIWTKMFDYRMLDQGDYSGRELSYLVDHLDFLMVAQSVKWGWPIFDSPVHWGLAVFIGVWLAWFAGRDLKLGSLPGLLLALLFWTTPFIYLHFLMRSAKGLTTAACVVLVVEIYRACRNRVGDVAALPRRFVVSLVTAGLVLSLSDRQGFYFLVMAFGFMGLHWGFSRARFARDIFLLLGGVVVFELVYFHWLAPGLIRLLCGYETDFSFSRLPWGDLGAKPGYYSGQALQLLGGTISSTLGRLPEPFVALLSVAALGAAGAWDFRRQSWRRQLPLAVLVGGVLAGLWLMYTLMILKHPPILWPDVQVIYYWIPTAALVILGLAVAAAEWAGSRAGRKVAVAVLLLGLVAANIAALPGHWVTFASGHLRESVNVTKELRYALMHRGDPNYLVPDAVAGIPAYPTLLAYAPERKYPPAPWDQFEFGELYRRTRSSGAPVHFIAQFGGNVDSRFIRTSGRFIETKSGWLIGATGGQAELFVNSPANRLQGEVLVQRTDEGVAPLAVDFAIYASPDTKLRFPRWSQRVELAAGQREATASYAIDGSHLPTFFTLDIPAGQAGAVRAGWRNPRITDVGSDSTVPRWLNRSSAPAIPLDENALAKLLPGTWRPLEAMMRHGEVTGEGIELSAGGEIWLHVRQIVSRFAGTATVAAGFPVESAPPVRGLWYKAGRLETYAPPAARAGNLSTFQAWCAEPGGWLVIAAEPGQGMARMVVRVTDVRQE
ncbi:MAG: hypothetical protein JWQ62_1517 [Lacunisphaera sp.]|nr:hypothetical protein [Lacunisphaera sp.]